MTKKKNNPSINPSVNPTPEVKAATPDEIKGLGIRQVQRVINDKPIEVRTEGGRSIMDFQNVVETHTSHQPYLNQAEVEKLGIRGWWPYRNGEWTTITHGKRFNLSKEVFEDMKNQGLVLAVPIKEAEQWRNK